MGVDEPFRRVPPAVALLALGLLLASPPPVRGQPDETPEVAAPAKADLLAALRSWGVPADTWALLSLETANRLVAEQPEGPLLESPDLLARLGCVVARGEPGTALLSDAPRLHMSALVVQRLSTLASIRRVCSGAPGDLQPWLAEGAWVAVDELGEDAFSALSDLSGPGPQDPDMDSPNIYVRVWALLECDLRAAGSEEILRRVVVRTAAAAQSLPVLSLADGPTAPRCCVGIEEYRTAKERGPVGPPLGELPDAAIDEGAVDPFDPEAALRLFPGPDSAEGLEPGRPTVWTLREWAAHVAPLAGKRHVNVARDTSGLLLVVPEQCQSWLDTVTAVRSLGGLDFIDGPGTCIVWAEPIGWLPPRDTLNGIIGDWCQSVARRLLDAQWPARTGTPLSPEDRDALAGTGGFAPLSPAAAAFVWAAPRVLPGHGGASSARVGLTDAQTGEVIYDSGAAADPAPEGLEVRAVPTVAIELARIARYGETSATTLLRETLQADGLDPGTEPLFALAAVRQLGTVRAPDQREEE